MISKCLHLILPDKEPTVLTSSQLRYLHNEKKKKRMCTSFFSQLKKTQADNDNLQRRRRDMCIYRLSILGRMGYIHRDWEREKERGHEVVLHRHRHGGTETLTYMYMHIPKSCNIQTFNGEKWVWACYYDYKIATTHSPIYCMHSIIKLIIICRIKAIKMINTYSRSIKWRHSHDD